MNHANDADLSAIRAAFVTQPLGSNQATNYQTQGLPTHQFHYDQPQTAAAPKGFNSRTVALGLGVFMIGGLALAAFLLFRSGTNRDSPDGVAASLEKSVRSGNLVTLSGDDAYTHYFHLRNLDSQHKSLAEIKPSVLPQLRTIGDEVFRRRVNVSLESVTEPDWTRAMRAYEWAHVMEPEDKVIESRWKYAAGDLARLQGKRDEGVSNLQAATELDPSWAPAQNDLGYLYVSIKRFADAVPLYQRAIDLNGAWDIPYNNLGTAHFYQRNYDVAERWYQKALEVNSQWATPHAWLGSIYENRKAYDAAIQEYQMAVNLFNADRDRINTVELENKITALRNR